MIPTVPIQAIDFLEWTESYVNQLDPLHSQARSGEYTKSGSYHYQTDIDRIKSAFARLLGSDWASAWKVSADYTPKLKTGSYGYYGERSVFEVESPKVDSDTDGSRTTATTSTPLGSAGVPTDDSD